MNRENWDDLRYVLAVAENGSVSAAARRLGVNHATVLRRISAFEEREGTEVFDRSMNTYQVLPTQIRLIDAAREVEAAVNGVRRILQGGLETLSGVVRVTSTDTMCQWILPRALSDIRREAPDLRIDLISDNSHLDLARLEAEITVRPAVALPDGLSGEVATPFAFDVYAAPGTPKTWLGMSGSIKRSQPGKWMDQTIAPDTIVAEADSFIVLREMAAAGLGQAVLPCWVGDPDSRLERRRGILPEAPVDIWVACHSDLVTSPRVRLVCDRLITALRAEAKLLLGQ